MAQLAEKAGLTPSTISMLHKRNNLLLLPTLHTLFDAFGITISQFFSDCNLPLDLSAEQIKLLEQWITLNNE
jgi:transcriptional regulator with XRE-family HTH domain